MKSGAIPMVQQHMEHLNDWIYEDYEAAKSYFFAKGDIKAKTMTRTIWDWKIPFDRRVELGGLGM